MVDVNEPSVRTFKLAYNDFPSRGCCYRPANVRIKPEVDSPLRDSKMISAIVTVTALDPLLVAAGPRKLQSRCGVYLGRLDVNTSSPRQTSQDKGRWNAEAHYEVTVKVLTILKKVASSGPC
jgi:hypothetical protein